MKRRIIQLACAYSWALGGVLLMTTTKSRFLNDTTYSDQITIMVLLKKYFITIVALLLHSENLDVTKRGTVAPQTKLQTVCLLASLPATTLAITLCCRSTTYPVSSTLDRYHRVCFDVTNMNTHARTARRNATSILHARFPTTCTSIARKSTLTQVFSDKATQRNLLLSWPPSVVMFAWSA